MEHETCITKHKVRNILALNECSMLSRFDIGIPTALMNI